MAEMAVSIAREKLLPLAIDEANLLWELPKEFAEIKDELEYIQAFLKDADRRAADEGDDMKEGIRKWVKDLREASFRIEDVIDEYMIHVEYEPRGLGCTTLLCEIFHFVKSLMSRHQIASEIQQIKSFVREIKQRSKDYQFQIQGQSSQSSVQWHDPRRDARYLDEDEVVGIEGPRDELIGWLAEGPEDRIVISVVGMGGLGKTTLVNKVFNNQKVAGHFDLHAWITVSQSYTVEGLLKDLLKKLCDEEKKPRPRDISEMNQEALTDEVRKHLQHKRYVVIFDDIWNVEFWGQIRNAMFANKNGSRILITTRKQEVVVSCKSTLFDQVHEMKPLTSEESLKLFWKKAFQFDNNGCRPEDLKNISLDIVKKCKGLPLAIVAIGGLLSSKKKNTIEWGEIWQCLSSELEKNHHLKRITKILGFSYDDLPIYLKSCLLYFGMYPEDYDVKSTRLIRQWIAEGFVKGEERKTLENVAQQYLTELIGRSLVQVTSFTKHGIVRSCCVHDLLREMILSKFKDLSFGQHISKEDELVSSETIRRLSIATNSNNLIGSTESSRTRSLLVLTGENSLSNNFLQRIPTKYKLLKVLDFEDAHQLSIIPGNWGNLTHLKYLSLRRTKLLTVYLPEFICKLQNLETLDIRNTFVYEIPKEIGKLKKLRHLLGHRMILFQLKDDIGGMASLQTLRHVKVTLDQNEVEMFKHGDAVELIREIGKLKQLRNLGFMNVKKEHGSALCSTINEMQKLEKLHIESKSMDEVLDLPVISSLHMLQKLNLWGKLNKFPEWVPHLENLVKLSLRCCSLIDDPLKSLQNLQHLLFLEIGYKAYEGESLYFQDGGYQQLKELHLRYLFNLNSIIIDKGALSSLKKIQFWKISQLKTVPLGIQHLKKLEVFDIYHGSTEFNKCIAPDEGPENPFIQHVPLVRITTSSFEEGTKTQVIHHSRH